MAYLVTTIIFTILLSIFLAYKNYYHKLETYFANTPGEQRGYSKRWHKYQLFLQLTIGAAIGVLSYFNFHNNYDILKSVLLSLFLALIFGAQFWILFDGILNLLSAQNFFYISGYGSFIDSILEKTKKPYIITAVIKIIFLVIAGTGFALTYFLL